MIRLAPVVGDDELVAGSGTSGLSHRTRWSALVPKCRWGTAQGVNQRPSLSEFGAAALGVMTLAVRRHRELTPLWIAFVLGVHPFPVAWLILYPGRTLRKPVR